LKHEYVTAAHFAPDPGRGSVQPASAAVALDAAGAPMEDRFSVSQLYVRALRFGGFADESECMPAVKFVLKQAEMVVVPRIVPAVALNANMGAPGQVQFSP
jgi:hypothetical protein